MGWVGVGLSLLSLERSCPFLTGMVMERPRSRWVDLFAILKMVSYW